jgi:O-methyltransferase involved in polyketide biosynthesis
MRWVDVDLPEVVALRREVGLTEAAFSEGGSRDYRLVAASVTDEAWLENIPNDRPTIVVMEGLVSYLTEEEGKSLLRRLVQRFSRGGELLFETITEWLISKQSKVAALNKTEARLQWAAGDPKSLENLDPRLRMEEAIGLSESPGLVDFPLLGRLTMYMMSWIPQARDSSRFVRYSFTEEPSH